MRKVRITVDVLAKEHIFLKMACLKLGISLQEFMKQAAEEKLKKLQDEWQNIKNEGQEELISWDEMVERLSAIEV